MTDLVGESELSCQEGRRLAVSLVLAPTLVTAVEKGPREKRIPCRRASPPLSLRESSVAGSMGSACSVEYLRSRLGILRVYSCDRAQEPEFDDVAEAADS